MSITTDQLLTPKEAAMLAGIDRTYLYRLIQQHKWIEPVLFAGRKFYLRDAVEQWKDDREATKHGRCEP